MKSITFFIALLLIFWVNPLNAQQTRGIDVSPRSAETDSPAGTYRALLIGNDHYRSKLWPDLKTAVWDVTELNRLLQQNYGFHKENIILRTNADRHQMLKAFDMLQDIAKEADSVLIYYAGHGESNKRGGFWIPVATEIETDYIGNETVLHRLATIKTKHKLLISDSCFSGNLFTRSRNEDFSQHYRFKRGYYLDKSALISVQGISSGGNTPVADGCDFCGKHSIFAYHLLAVLKNNRNRYLSASELGLTISMSVSNDTRQLNLDKSSQSPIHSSIANQGDQGGEFFFVPTNLDTITIVPVGLYLIHNQMENHISGFSSVRNLLQKELEQEISRYSLKVALTRTLNPTQLESALKQDLTGEKVKAAIVVDIDGRQLKEVTMMYQGKVEINLKLKAFGIHQGQVIELADDPGIEPQVWPISRWREDLETIEINYLKAAEKITQRWSKANLFKFFAALEE